MSVLLLRIGLSELFLAIFHNSDLRVKLMDKDFLLALLVCWLWGAPGAGWLLGMGWGASWQR